MNIKHLVQGYNFNRIPVKVEKEIEKEINKMSYETMCEILTMIDYKKAKELYDKGKEVKNG